MRCASVIFAFLVLAQHIAPFLQQQPRCAVLRLPNGRVRARARGRIVRFSCYEGFTLVGNKYSTCVRGEWDTPTPVCVNAECPPLTTPEHALVATKYNGAILMYFCEAGYALIGATEIYCDGRQWNGTAPYCRNTSEPMPTRCDFEKPDLCWWEQDPQHDFDWQRHNFETPSSHIGTGPTHDHTLGPGNDGYYLYIEASGRLVNDTARIVSPLYNGSLSVDACFSFWYHMFGVTIGSLRVYFKPETETTPRLMFHKDGNQGNQWLQGIFSIPKVDTNFQIIIEGVRGASYVSDIAVDDVAILHGNECSANNSKTTATTARDDDQVELVNAQQSCRGRCGVATTEVATTIAVPGTAWNQDICHCTVDCAENSTCCPDYAEYCVLESDTTTSNNVAGETTTLASNRWATTGTSSPETTRIATTTPTTTTTSTTTTRTTRTPTTTRWRWPTAPTRPSSGDSSRNVIPTNPKDDLEPGPARPPPGIPTTYEPTRPTPTSRVATTVLARTTKGKPVESVTVRVNVTKSTTTTTTAATTTTTTERIGTGRPGETKETPCVQQVETTTEFACPDEATASPAVTSIYLADEESSSLSWMINVLEIVGGVASLVSVVAMLRALIKRRKAGKRNSSALSEDSDVRFLTSNEILDFSLARPSDNDDA